jgi:hypothetical protein
MHRKSNQQVRRDDEFRQVTTNSYMRNMAEYRVSTKCTDNLANANVEIRLRVFEKDFVNNIIEKTILKSHQSTQHEKLMRNKNSR